MNLNKKFWVSLYLLISILGYFFFFKPFTVYAENQFIEKILSEFTQSKQVLISPAKNIGLYRPELPFSLNGAKKLETQITSKVSLLSYYQAWGNQPENQFKLEAMNNMYEAGYTPIITWEPWTINFFKSDSIWQGSCKQIISGTYDQYIRNYAQDAIKFGKPFFIRPFHEMSNYRYQWSSHYGNSAKEIKEAWIHVYKIFEKAGAKNVAFIWTPYSVEDMIYYPGDDYVDWVGLDLFNFGSNTYNSQWLSFKEIYQPWKKALSNIKKPLMIVELGSTKSGGDRIQWYSDMLNYWIGANEIKNIVFFDHPAHRIDNNNILDLGIDQGKDLQSISTTDLMQKKLGIKYTNPNVINSKTGETSD